VLDLRRRVGDFEVTEGVCAALAADQQRVARASSCARRRRPSGFAPDRGSCFCPCAALMPLEMIVDFVRLPMWIILVPVSACWRLLVSATE